MSRTNKCRLARAWASWVAWSAMNKPLEPALKGNGRPKQPYVVNSFLTNAYALRWSRGGGVRKYAYAVSPPVRRPFPVDARAGRVDRRRAPRGAGSPAVIDWCAARPIPAREARSRP
ncbi:hypothetical protein GCM10023100_64360 [Actinocorallia cavernae]|uniref:Uncharacterized protein n=2 Tax=Actinomycetes TaxID=1760 RepID=A0ABN3N2W3_9ACTN